MSTPREASCQPLPGGFWANDLTPNDVDPLIERFIKGFQPGAPEDCWPWTGRRRAAGYGGLGRSLYAHRVAWVAFTGRALTGDLTIDHLCRNKLCVNPGHLEPVPLGENVRRARRGEREAL